MGRLPDGAFDDVSDIPRKRPRYTKVVTIRMTERQYRVLVEDAKKFKVGISDMIRWLIDEYDRDPS